MKGSTGCGRRASSHRPGFEYYPTKKTAHFEVYVPGSRRKRRLTLRNIENKARAEKLWNDFKEKVKGRDKQAALVSTTLREFLRECLVYK